MKQEACYKKGSSISLIYGGGKTSDLDFGFVINLLIKAKGKLEQPIRHKEIIS
jgi:hypothetical protein